LEISEQFSRGLVAALKCARESRGMSQSELAKRSGVSRAMINHLESGKRNPTIIVLHALAGALGANLSELIKALGH
jgi:transcriptional regulator with XRE-family HTH domain